MNFAFHSFSDFLSMGHRGVFVWSAWLLTVVAMVLLVIQTRVARKQFLQAEHAKLRRAKARNLSNEKLSKAQSQEHLG